MKNLLHILILCLLVPTTLFAQQNAPRRGDNGAPQHRRPDFGQYLQVKCDFVVTELGLSPQDSMRFVPVYRELQEQKSQLFSKYGGGRRVRHQLEQGQQVADTTLLRVVNNQARLQAEDAQLEYKFIERLAKVLSPMQLYKLQQAEQKFKTDMMKRGKPARK